MKLITEITEDYQVLYEEKDGKKSLYLEGITLAADVKNKNGRIYPEAILDNEVNRYIKEELEDNRAVGELGHPDGPTINLERVSHKFVSLRKDGKNWISKAIITETTPMGAIVKGLVGAGVKLGISSRGLGSLKQNSNGIMEVQDDYRLATAGDIVQNPSGPGCFLNGLMENVEWVFNPNTMSYEQLSITESLQKHVHENYKKITEVDKVNIFETWLNIFKQ